MDTSDQYIKMCKCLEIQLQEFDYRPNFHFAYYLHEQWQIEHDFLGGEKQPIWLPRQDQIQEMMDLKTVWCKAYWLYNFAEIHRNPNESFPFKSMEQLWLAFYMHEKHKKIWDSEKWVAG